MSCSFITTLNFKEELISFPYWSEKDMYMPLMMLSIMTDYKHPKTSNICLMVLVLFLQLHATVYVFGVPQGTELVAHEITTHAPRQAMV